MPRTRLRTLGIHIGAVAPGPHNAITDVSGVRVGHTTIIADQPRVARTGVTVILPDEKTFPEHQVFAGFHSFNGCGEMTGVLWVEESGLLTSPVVLTNTAQTGLVRDAISEYAAAQHEWRRFWLPVVGETWDGWLNDAGGRHITREHVFEAIETASAGPVAEGSVGGGTGMICHDFKGGIGTASRLVDTKSGRYTLGALVQTNYGDRHQLRVDGVPVGREIPVEEIPSPWETPPLGGSIVVVLATDAPLLPIQCKRLAQRAGVGLSRAGGVGQNTSGDLFFTFATGNRIPLDQQSPISVDMLPNQHLNPLFEAAGEAVEEAIINALTATDTMTGFQGHTAYALPLDRLVDVMAKYGRIRDTDG